MKRASQRVPFRHIDPRWLGDAAAGRAALAARLAHLAIETLGEQIEACESTLHLHDDSAWERVSHNLKGTLAILGAKGAVEQVQHLENLGRCAPQTVLAVAALREAVGGVQEELQRMLQASEGRIAANGQAAR